MLMLTTWGNLAGSIGQHIFMFIWMLLLFKNEDTSILKTVVSAVFLAIAYVFIDLAVQTWINHDLLLNYLKGFVSPLIHLFLCWPAMKANTGYSGKEAVIMTAIGLMFFDAFQIAAQFLLIVDYYANIKILNRIFITITTDDIYGIPIYREANLCVVMMLLLWKPLRNFVKKYDHYILEHPYLAALCFYIFSIAWQRKILHLFEHIYDISPDISYQLVLIIFICIFLFSMSQKHKSDNLVNEKNQMNIHLKANEDYLEKMTENHQKLEDKHLLAERLRILTAVVDVNNQEAVDEYIRRTIDLFDGKGIVQYSGNAGVNALLNYYHNRYPDCRLEVDSRINNQCGIDSCDLTSLIMNLIDQRLIMMERNIGERMICLKLFRVGEMMNVLVKGPLFTDQNTAESFESAVIQNVVSKYNGIFNAENENNPWNAVLLQTICKGEGRNAEVA